jgi:hypothetical protein
MRSRRHLLVLLGPVGTISPMDSSYTSPSDSRKFATLGIRAVLQRIGNYYLITDELATIRSELGKSFSRLADQTPLISTEISYTAKGCISLEMSTNDQTSEFRRGYLCSVRGHCAIPAPYSAPSTSTKHGFSRKTSAAQMQRSD